MKILKAQSGVVYTPEIRDVYIPSQQAATSAGKTSSSDTSGKMDDMTKEIIETLDTNGIPIDVEAFSGYMQQLLSSARNIYSTGSTSNTISQLIALKNYANKVSYNAKQGEAARRRITTENTGSDIALTTNGYIYAMTDDGELTAIDPNTYYKNQDEYQALTNNELLRLRENSPQFAFNTTVLDDINNSVSMKAVMEQITGIIQKFDKTKQSGYTVKQGQLIQNGLEALIGGGPDGYYKFSTEMDKGASAAERNAAVNYLYQNLTTNAKNTLRAHAAANGLDPNTEQGLFAMLSNALHFNTGSTITVDYEEKMTENAMGGGSGSSGGDKNKVQMSYVETVAYGHISDEQQYVFGRSSDKHGILVSGQAYPWLDSNDDQLEQNNIKQLLIESPLGVMVNKESISFGNQVLNDLDLNRVIWDGSSNVVRAWLPKDLEAEASGIIKPDLDAAEKYEQFVKWVSDNPGVTPQQQQIKIHELGLRLEYDPQTGTWLFPKEDMHLFLTTSGYASDQAIDIEDESWVDEVSRNEGSRLIKRYETLANLGTNSPTKNEIATDDVKLGTPMLRWIGANGASSFVKSSIYMPVSDAKLSTVATNREYVPRDYYNDILNRSKYKQQQKSLTTNF